MTPTSDSHSHATVGAQTGSPELTRSHARLQVLAAASNAFASVATDYPRLLEKIASMTAELVGDGCLVTLLDAQGQNMINVASAHRDPSIAADYIAYLAGREISSVDSTTVSAEVMRTGTPKLVTQMTPETMVAQSEESLRPVVARLNVHSYVVVPIRSRMTTLGTLSLFRSGPDHDYTDDDLTLLQDLADRAGLAVDNARLYDSLERRVEARTLELEVVNKELEAFSASVAHDLRAPLRGIDGFSQILLDDFGEQLGTQGGEHLARIRTATRRMTNLIDDLLTFSRTTRGDLRRESVDLSEIANAVLTRLAETHPERQVELRIEAGLMAQADLRLCEVVLTNLLSNAWKFTSKRTAAWIELDVDRTRQPPTFFVRDNGAGFDSAHASKLFGVFQRLHDAREFDGTGIGLATVQRIVRRHGGRIWAQAELDRGATFFFTLQAE